MRSAAVQGIESYRVTVEVDCSSGLPQFTVVGLPAGAVKESRERVNAALANSGFVLPARRITVNLAPADVRKDGTAFDLPIALGVLAASGQIRGDNPALQHSVFLGELGLDGSLRPVRGVLSVARRLKGKCTLVVPPENVGEATLARSVPVATFPNLAELVRQLKRGDFHPVSVDLCAARQVSDVDFSDVTGQTTAKRALEIAAAGGHAVLLVGPPGAGKTMLARRLPTILPELSEEESLEVIAIQSAAGLLSNGMGALPLRPFRAPHHTVSTAGLIGGGSVPRPGEVSLAHNGVLFLDEMLEFPRHVLDSLRQPIEDGRVVLARASGMVEFPSRFSLVGAFNPCMCGLSGTTRANECSCSDADVMRYRARLSGPLRDRMDLTVNVNAVPVSELAEAQTGGGEKSAVVRERVTHARALQAARFSGMHGVRCNAQASGAWIQSNARMAPDARSMLLKAVDRLQLSARAYHRVIKVALTISDLCERDWINREAVAEALRYR